MSIDGLDETLRILGVIVALIGGIAGAVKIWRDAKSASGQTQVAALEKAATAQAAAADEWREIKDDYRSRLVAAEAKSAEQDARLDALRRDVDTLRETEGLLVRWLRHIRHGVQRGTIPPWPIDPIWLQELEQRYDDATTD